VLSEIEPSPGGGPYELTDPTVLDGNAGFRFQILGMAAGEVVRIEASEDLETWTFLGSVSSIGREVWFIDEEAVNVRLRYYRVVAL
jgi:uncharacterized protein (DUF2126 family)